MSSTYTQTQGLTARPFVHRSDILIRYRSANDLWYRYRPVSRRCCSLHHETCKRAGEGILYFLSLQLCQSPRHFIGHISLSNIPHKTQQHKDGDTITVLYTCGSLFVKENYLWRREMLVLGDEGEQAAQRLRSCIRASKPHGVRTK